MRDLDKIYGSVKQRERRDQYASWCESARLARDAAKAALARPSKQAVDAFARLERMWLAQRDRRLVPLAGQMREAFEAGLRSSGGRRVNTYLAGADPEKGWVYALTSDFRPGEVKIGHTTNDVRRRLTQIRRTQSLPDAQVCAAKWVRWPARLEHRLQQRLRSSLVAGWAPGESIEWFRVEPDVVSETLSSLLAEFADVFVSEGTPMYSCDSDGHELWTLPD